MQELFLYDRDKGLFKEILKQSTIIKGNYHVSTNGGNDLNTTNLNNFINDPASGLIDATNRYPLCVCVTPKSKIVKYSGGRWEQFYFNLFFVTLKNKNADNTIKSMNDDTLSSAHHTWYDWQDMKDCADNFIEVFKLLQRRIIDVDGAGLALGNYVQIDADSPIFTRLTTFNNDQLNGCLASFTILMNKGAVCSFTDYNDIVDIVIPPFDIHLASNDQ